MDDTVATTVCTPPAGVSFPGPPPPEPPPPGAPPPAEPPLQALPIRELEARITELAGHLNAANHRWLQLIAEFDRRLGWSDGVTHSCAHWLSWKCGLELGAAREKVRVARALETLPMIDGAMGRGELSYSKVRALTRVATPATEPVLLNVARHGTTHHVEKLVRQFRRVQEVEEVARAALQHASRKLTYYHDDDGSLVVKLRLAAESGALLLKALDAALADAPLPPHSAGAFDNSRETSGVSAAPPGALIDGCSSRNGSGNGIDTAAFAGDRPGWSARRADALVAMAESYLKHGAAALSGGERHQIVVHVDESTLGERSAGRCGLEGGPAVPIETARRLACDASVVAITEDARGEPLDVGRKTRSIPPSLRRALKSRDQGCVFPGCSHQRFVDGHHIQHWAAGGKTRLSNLVSLCRFHHRAVHEGGVTVERVDDGAWRFTNRHGQVLESCAPGHTRSMGSWQQLVADHHQQGLRIDAKTAATRWLGEKMDYGITIDALLWRARRGAEGVAGET